MQLLEVCDVTKRFGGLLALNHVHCTIEQGQITGLIGPNGAGKTTLFNLIAGEFVPDQGSILLQGAPIHRLPSNVICKRGIARTFQMVRPFLNLTTLRNVAMAAAFGCTPTPSRQQAEAMAWHWLEFISLTEKAHVLARHLALGERKRLEIARALATQPQLLLLDEAIAGLNPAEVSQIMCLIREVQRTGVTIFLIEHVMKAVLGLSDKVIVLNYGEKIAEGPPQEVANDPQVVAAYLGQKRQA
ncbi:MAG TPA: ABC transporter ATP-binding protein [Candidatus Tectomicrobia bacterium]|jgi:branched-chain amino acid transport system ATP-binding protein